jgi:hypothetical protein
MRGGKEDEE